MSDNLEERVLNLEIVVAHLMKERPGRKPVPILVSEYGVCGLNPDQDSSTCTNASLYRRQKGCLGDACRNKSAAYYQEYRAKERLNKKSVQEVTINE